MPSGINETILSDGTRGTTRTHVRNVKHCFIYIEDRDRFWVMWDKEPETTRVWPLDGTNGRQGCNLELKNGF